MFKHVFFFFYVIAYFRGFVLSVGFFFRFMFNPWALFYFVLLLLLVVLLFVLVLQCEFVFVYCLSSHFLLSSTSLQYPRSFPYLLCISFLVCRS